MQDKVTLNIVDADIDMLYKLIENSSSNNSKDLEMFKEVLRLQSELKKVGIVFKKDFTINYSKRVHKQ